MTEVLCLGVALALAQAPKPPGANTPGSPAPPLNEYQLGRIKKLADDTQKEAVRLKTLLDHRQKELAGVYSKYELDEKRATQLETEILDIQKKMLANYRKMQVELRTLIGEERFTILKQRLDRMLQPPAEKPTPKTPRQ